MSDHLTIPFSEKQLKDWIYYSQDIADLKAAVNIAKQLLATMQREAKLRELLKWGMNKYAEGYHSYADNWYAEAESELHARSEYKDV